MSRPSKISKRRYAAGIAAVVAVTAGAALTAAPAEASPVHGKVYGANSASAVKGHFVVLLNAKAGKSHEQDVAKAYGGRLGRNFSSVNGFSATGLTRDEAGRLAADPDVDKVVQSKKFHIDTTQANPPSWGLDRVDQKDLPLDKKYSYPDGAGEGATAYVIDTGVRISHKDFGNRASYGYDAVDGDDKADDGHGHGTHVAGTIAGTAHGVAKKAKVVAVRVLDDQGSGSTEQVVGGIDWVTKHHKGASVANLSLGGGADEAIDTAVRKAVSSGVTVAVAAGNESSDAGQSSPARVKEALTVAASDKSDKQAEFSNYGSAVDLYAPGVDIVSDFNTSDDATHTYSGTSQATPHVAGGAAVYLGTHPDAKPDAVAKALDGAAASDKISNPGKGSPNKLLQITK